VFSSLPEQRALVSTVGALVLSYAFCLCLSALSYILFCIFVALAPLLSLALFRDDFGQNDGWLSETTISNNAKSDKKRLAKPLGSTLLAIFLLSVFVGAATYFSGLFGSREGMTGLERNLVLTTIVAALVLMGGRWKRAVTTDNLLKFCTLIAAIFAILIPLLGTEYPALWYASSLAFQLARIALWVLLARICSGLKISVLYCFGWGWAVHNIGLLLGEVFTRVYFAQVTLDDFSKLTIFALFVMACILLFYVVGSRPLNAVKLNQETEQTKQRKFDVKLESVAMAHGLTAREAELLKYLAKGYSSKAIQEELFISASTVSAHSSSIFKKLDVHSKEQVAQLVRDWGIEENPEA
ncbi:MAG: hypothetical protein IKD70_08485, partial [Eggerthellaceae bacterium]|nr:hypothetical protein [Eggerthellaceae bacterium]